jgi:putative endonuclease
VKRQDRGKAARARGRRAEWQAALLLALKGYRIVARNARTPVGEIDLVARRGRIVAFVEVKARPDHSLASDALRADQQGRIIRAGEWFLAARPDLGKLDRRYDVILVAPGRWPIHLRDAWRQ